MRGVFVALSLLAAVPAGAETIDGTWLIEHKAAVRVYACGTGQCGQVVWLRNPALRTEALCNQTVLWGLEPSGPGQWSQGWFRDPENSTTYHVNVQRVSDEQLQARVYPSFAWLGETVSMLGIKPGSLAGWCR